MGMHTAMLNGGMNGTHLFCQLSLPYCLECTIDSCPDDALYIYNMWCVDA